MNAAELARTAYTSSQTTIRTDRSHEYHAFGRVTRSITEAAARGASAFPALAAALHDNRKLWQIIASDVSHNDNALPKQLRARLFYLSEFTNEHTRKILLGEGDVAPLVDINTSVMRGLKGSNGGIV